MDRPVTSYRGETSDIIMSAVRRAGILFRAFDCIPQPDMLYDQCCCFCDDLCPYWSGKSNNPRLCMKACTPCSDKQANLKTPDVSNPPGYTA